MSAPTDIQMTKPSLCGRESNLIPNEVVGATMDGTTPIQAWREHLGLTQEVVAQRMGITHAAYAKYEKSLRPGAPTTARIAVALGITKEQLNF